MENNTINFNKYDFTADKIFRTPNDSGEPKNIPLYIPLYHGTTKDKLIPVFNSKPSRNDYNSGFYMTLDLEQARQWAAGGPVKDAYNMSGYVHRYLLDTAELSILSLNDMIDINTNRPYNALFWLAILVNNRRPDIYDKDKMKKFIKKYYIDAVNNFDVVIGYRADATFAKICNHLFNGELAVSKLEEALRAGDLGDQVMIRTKKAFDSLYEIPIKHPTYFEKVNPKYGVVYNKNKDKADKIVQSLVIGSKYVGDDNKIDAFLK